MLGLQKWLANIGFIAYGESFNCLNSSTMHTWVRLFFDVARFHAFHQAMGRLPGFLRGAYKAWYMPKNTKANQKLENELSLVSLERRASVVTIARLINTVTGKSPTSPRQPRSGFSRFHVSASRGISLEEDIFEPTKHEFQNSYGRW